MSGNGVELATAYVSLVVESSKIPGEVNKTLTGLQPQAQRAGEGIGAKLAGGVGTTFKTAAAGIGLIAGAAIGTAISKGFTRMVAIDDAKGKLAGLGHEAQGVASIMASANAAVRGTAFGMGEAATAAASAVAAGIQQGEALTNYLKVVGDTATIAGTDLATMGSIFNKVQTSGKAYTDDLNMLADRGIPIFQWLQQEYGKSAEELSKMVKDGKVDSATFRRVIEENIGGAALESGKTLRGSWKNMQAALGRIGEAAMSPFLDMAKSSLAGITAWADQVKPHVEKAAKYVANGLTEMGAAFQSHGKSIEGPASNWEKFGVKARYATDGLKGIFSLLKDGRYLGKNMTFGFEEDSKVVDYILRFRSAVGKLVDAVKSKDLDGIKGMFEALRGGKIDGSGYTEVEGIGQTLTQTFRKLADATNTVGRSLASMLGDAGVVGAEVLEFFGRQLAMVADNTWLVTAGLYAYVGAMVATKAVHVGFEAMAAFRSMLAPATISAQLALSRALVAHNAAIREYLASIGREVAVTPGVISGRLARARAWATETYAANQASSALTRFSALATQAAVSTTGLNAALMRGAASALAFGGRVQAVATTAMAGLRNSVGGLMSMLGGPWGIALAAAGVGLMGHFSAADQAKRVHQALADAVVKGAKAQTSFKDAVAASNGALDASGISAASKLVQANLASITETAKEGQHWWISLQKHVFTWNASEVNAQHAAVQRSIDQNDTLRNALSAQRLEMDDLGKIVAEGGAKYSTLIGALEATGDAGADVVAAIKRTRAEIQTATDAAKNSTPGFGSLSDAVRKLADESATADDRMNSLKQALDAISGKPVELEDAMQSYNKAIRDVTDSTKAAWDASDGFGESLVDKVTGGIDTTTENGDKLRTKLLELRDETLRVGAAGGDLGPVFARNETVLADLARATGLSVEQMKALAESAGYVPSKIELLIALKGATEAKQDLTTIRTMLGRNELTIDTKLLGSDQVIRDIQAAGGKVEEVAGKPGVFRVDAPNVASVISKVDDLLAKINALPANKTVKVTYAEATASGEWRAPMKLPQQRAAGGPIFGPGGPTSDSVPALLSAGEHVWTAEEVAAAGGHGAMLGLRARAKAGGLAFAAGGTPDYVTKAVSAARSVEGNLYDWGGVGPTRFDCSGFVGWLQQILMGVEAPTKRLYTTMSLLDGATSGLESGLGPAGTWFKVGVSQDHMAGTLAGLAVESGGAFGTSGVGGNRAKATDGQFPWKFHLPNELIKGYGSLTTGGKLVEWTDQDERDLERARIAVTEARERRDEVYGNADSTDSERRRADLDVDDAEAKAVDKQAQKDKQGTTEGGERVAPQAPALTEAYNVEKAARIDALQAVEEANAARNEVYDDPSSTDLDKAKADQDLAKAQEEANAVSNSESSAATTVRGIFTNAASSAAGVLFDAAKEIFLPDAVADSHWWDVADEVVSLANSDTDDDGTSNVAEILSAVGSFNLTDVMKQQGYNGDTPKWALNAKVFDSGGWLMPGEVGVNLSSKPEPIFNSPSQLAQFTAGASLDPPAGAYAPASIERLERAAGELAAAARQPHVTFQTENINGAMRAYTFEQNKQTAKSRRR
ncbi:tape measure protein [Nocardia sp. NPDC057663]|uniref:tape measure protein n=1 Tax=Nocardia sp. NPDC057663 TaxID=3346201 RepID=UPI00367287CC